MSKLIQVRLVPIPVEMVLQINVLITLVHQSVFSGVDSSIVVYAEDY